MSDAYERVIYENLDKGKQLNLTVSEFRDLEYVHLREYFLSYEGEWTPSKIGVSFPANIESIYALLDGLLEIISIAEGDEIIQKYADRINPNKFSLEP